MMIDLFAIFEEWPGYDREVMRNVVRGVVCGYKDCCIEFFCSDWNLYTCHGYSEAYLRRAAPHQVNHVPCPSCLDELEQEIVAYAL